MNDRTRSVQVVTTMPECTKERGKKAAKKMFGSDNKFSTYLQALINKDCDEKGIE